MEVLAKLFSNSFTISKITTAIGLVIILAWLWQEVLNPVRLGTTIDFVALVKEDWVLLITGGGFIASRDANKNDQQSKVDH